MAEVQKLITDMQNEVWTVVGVVQGVPSSYETTDIKPSIDDEISTMRATVASVFKPESPMFYYVHRVMDDYELIHAHKRIEQKYKKYIKTLMY